MACLQPLPADIRPITKRATGPSAVDDSAVGVRFAAFNQERFGDGQRDSATGDGGGDGAQPSVGMILLPRSHRVAAAGGAALNGHIGGGGGAQSAAGGGGRAALGGGGLEAAMPVSTSTARSATTLRYGASFASTGAFYDDGEEPGVDDDSPADGGNVQAAAQLRAACEAVVAGDVKKQRGGALGERPRSGAIASQTDWSVWLSKTWRRLC
jgi:hypothetical protein